MSFDGDTSVKNAKLIHLEDAIVWELIALSAAKPPKVFHPQSLINLHSCKVVVSRNVRSFKMDDTWQGTQARFLSLYFHQGIFSQPLLRYEERFFISSNRVRLWRGNATRNEEMPNPCDVKLNEGKKGERKVYVSERHQKLYGMVHIIRINVLADRYPGSGQCH